MRTFWAQGYEGASIDTLSRVTRMPRATIYQDYGGKEGLFLAAVAHYSESRLATVASQLDGGRVLRTDLLAFFDAAVDLATADPATPGCLISCVLADAAGSHPGLREELARRYARLERRIEARLASAADRGELSGSVDFAALALVSASLARGLMLRARAGAPAEQLRGAARVAVAAFFEPIQH